MMKEYYCKVNEAPKRDDICPHTTNPIQLKTVCKRCVKELDVTKLDIKIEAMEQVLLRVYNDGFIFGGLGRGDEDDTIDKAIREIIVIIGQ